MRFVDITQSEPTAQRPAPTRWRAIAVPAAVAGAGVLAVVAVHLRDPHVEGSWGICPVYALTGVYCPGCGGMRAVHNLTEGQVLDSLHSNLIALPLLMLFAVWVGDWAIRAWRGKPMRHFGINALTMWSIFGFLAVFTVLRNTPWGSWLTPV